MGDIFWLIPAPLLIALLLVFIFGDKLQDKSGIVGAAGSGLVFLLSLSLAPQMLAGQTLTWQFEWFSGVMLGFRLDGLAWTMLLLVSFLVTLILTYSYAYMHDEKGLRRFFCFMVLFAFSMVQLIVADNLLQMFVFWEVMGLCSYSLIGFYFAKNSAAAASKKAFMTTRVGDVFMLIGILVLYAGTGSFNYDVIFAMAQSGALPTAEVALAALLIFGGVVGKSAQFPLHIWLPDAMEGPTPVSSLIHAAAMVKAGMYLVIRLYPLYEMSPAVLNIILMIGTITVIFAALMAVFADDFKQVLAFSTISQLGYMTVALGCLGAVPALLHVINHAFFKALLFLGAGSVIHSVGTGDIRKMGGVLKYQKITGITMLLATFSIAGIPGFSGFISKDEILLTVYESGNMMSYYILLLTGMLTAFYMFRLFFLVFTGSKRSDYHGHESPLPMTVPLMILGVASVFSGQLKYPVAGLLQFSDFPYHYSIVVYSSVAAAVIGILGAFLIYYKQVLDMDTIGPKISGIKTFFLNRYYIDYVVEVVCKYTVLFGGKLFLLFEKYVIDGIVNGMATVTRALSGAANVNDRYVFDGAVRGIEKTALMKGKYSAMWNTGRIQHYLTWAIAGVILIVFIMGGIMQ